MAKFQLRVVGSYFGSPITAKPEFGNGYSVTGPIVVDIPGATAPSISQVMDEVMNLANNNGIPNCSGMLYNSARPAGEGSTENLYSIILGYTLDPVSRQSGDFIYYLQEDLTGTNYDQVLQYYLYDVPNPGDATASISQVNRAGDRVPFSQPISNIPGFTYDPNGTYYIVWRLVTIATGPTRSNKLKVRLEKAIAASKKS